MLTEKPRLPIRQMLLMGWLPSPLKKFIYRLKGYQIGRGVSLGFGTVICGRDVSIGDHTHVGFLSFVRGKSIRIGAHVQIGSTTMLDTPHLEIGDGTRINEQVFVGGLQFPDSRLVVGRNCQIMQMSFINPARSITIGDDTGIGGHCLLFGHTSWLSAFEGYPVDFQPIEIGHSVSLAWRVFLLPGVRIGDGAVIGANSLVKGTIPPRCLAVGFPARVVSVAPEFPREVSEEDRRRILHEVVAAFLAFLEGSEFTCETRGSFHSITEVRRTWRGRRKTVWGLQVADSDVPAGLAEALPPGTHVFLSLKTIPAAVRVALERRGVVWIDLERKERADAENPLAEETVQFLRRYGVRFFRVRSDGQNGRD